MKYVGYLGACLGELFYGESVPEDFWPFMAVFSIDMIKKTWCWLEVYRPVQEISRSVD